MQHDYPNPTPAMLDNDPLFDAIWQAIKGWDISRYNDGLYSGPTGSDARHIYDAIREVLMPDKSPTFRDFNPDKNPGVDEIKVHTDELIAIVRKLAKPTPEGQRRMSLAVTHYENAAMWAVKSLFE